MRACFIAISNTTINIAACADGAMARGQFVIKNTGLGLLARWRALGQGAPAKGARRSTVSRNDWPSAEPLDKSQKTATQQRATTRRTLLLTSVLLTQLSLSSCASEKFMFHSFSFNAFSQSPDIEVMDYQYGAKGEYEKQGYVGLRPSK